MQIIYAIAKNKTPTSSELTDTVSIIYTSKVRQLSEKFKEQTL